METSLTSVLSSHTATTLYTEWYFCDWSWSSSNLEVMFRSLIHSACQFLFTRSKVSSIIDCCFVFSRLISSWPPWFTDCNAGRFCSTSSWKCCSKRKQGWIWGYLVPPVGKLACVASNKNTNTALHLQIQRVYRRLHKIPEMLDSSKFLANIW